MNLEMGAGSVTGVRRNPEASPSSLSSLTLFLHLGLAPSNMIDKQNLELGAGTFSGFGGILKLVQLPFLPGFINIGPAPSRKEKNEVE